MIYVLESGAYGNKGVRIILEGPEDTSIASMLQTWAAGLSDDVLMAMVGQDLSKFMQWLLQQPGWREMSHRTDNVGDPLLFPVLESRRRTIWEREHPPTIWDRMRFEASFKEGDR